MTKSKTYEFPSTWFNTNEELVAMFGDKMGELRAKHVEAGKVQAAIWQEMQDLAASVASTKVENPTGTYFKLIRARTGAIGLTLDRIEAKKAPKAAKVPVTDKLAAFGTPKLYTVANGKATEKAEAMPDLPPELDRTKGKGKKAA